jgi:hypothetical protein
MSNYKMNCDICSKLEQDYAERFVDIKTVCPSYYIARGQILDIKDNLVIMALPGSGIIVICCDNISFVRPSPPF